MGFKKTNSNFVDFSEAGDLQESSTFHNFDYMTHFDQNRTI